MRALYLLIPLIAVGLVGCNGSSGPPPVPVSGKVTLGGKAVDGAVVTFISSTGGRSAAGRTGTDDGAVPGEYKVTITKQESKVGGTSEIDVSKGNFGEAYGAMMGAAGANQMSKVIKDTIPAKYGSAADSGLGRTVVKGEANNFEFDL